MSRTILICLLWLGLMITCRVFGQETENSLKGQSAYGVKAGVNFAELWGRDALPESDRKVGYSIGAFGTFKLSKTLKIQPEAIWSLQGESSKENGRYKITYLNFPLMLKWTQDRWYSEVGPQLGLQTINTTKSVPDNLRLEDFETFDFSINVGVGYPWDEDWSVGLRYSQGLTNLVRGRELKNSVVYLGLAYRIF
ncbi:hypothetical protein Aoki45_17400 [Algoriphagus sp. oki45]|uniref:porin family protein n=1 Tax=Algoriphagus sp. oki45 TaxID=3067294 RepID=UPI0027E718B3|nr:hypothetical protein Aoki45_17400 [Algoriphagus sp. oki45]